MRLTIRNHLRTRSRGQAVLEFALALPVLLALLFGVIEFGRLLQAWLAVQNSARFGLRYAVTGEFDPNYCDEAASALALQSADTYNGDPANDCHVPDSYGSNARDLSEQLEDWARLPSIRDAARAGIAGTAASQDVSISGDYLAYLTSHNLSDLGNPTLRSYFHVMVCSNRDRNLDKTPDFGRDLQTDPETCKQLTPSPSIYMDDAGGPGDRVRVTVTFMHPMILPGISNLWPEIRLTAWREGIVEKFRASRISGLGSQISIAPTDTPVPTDTPTPTVTRTPTETSTPTVSTTPTTSPTSTNTSTPTATPTPSCNDLQTSAIYFQDTINSGTDIIAPMGNSGQYSITLTSVNTSWNASWHDQVDPMPSDQAFDAYNWGGSQVWLDRVPDVPLSPGFSISDSNLNPSVWQIVPGQYNWLGLRFTKSFTRYWVYYHLADFQFSFTYQVGNLQCGPRTLTGDYGPVVQAIVSPQPQNQITGPFSVEASAIDPGGSIQQVKFDVFDSSGQYVGGATDTAAPYCLFGDSGGVCLTRSPLGTWPNSNNVINNGTYTIQIQATDNDYPQNQKTRIQTVITIQAPPPCSTTGSGLRGFYFDNEDFTNLSVVSSPQIVYYDWGFGSPYPAIHADTFSVSWQGWVQPLYSEAYRIYISSDDGMRVSIGGTSVVSDWSSHSEREVSGTTAVLTRCQLYPITVEYYELTNRAVAKLSWSSNTQNKQPIPVQVLYPVANSITPAPQTPTATATFVPTSTSTPTPLPTKPPNTNTPTPTSPPPTSTPVTIVPTTPVPSPTNPLPTNTITQTPAPSKTPTTTPTPTPCMTPTDLGGCH